MTKIALYLYCMCPIFCYIIIFFIDYYIIKESCFFTALPKTMPPYKPEVQPVRRREPLAYNYWLEDKESAPCFTFLLRPRVMQFRQTCKLLCCLSGKPFPTVSLLLFFLFLLSVTRLLILNQ